jgi:outer membrane autotransporter protein
MYRLIGYGSYALDERTEINFQADVGLSRNQGRRQIALTSTVASASYDSRSTHLGAGIGRTYTLNDRTSLIPSARLDYTWFRDESYTETGAGPLNLQVNARTSEALLVALDARLNHRIDDRITLMANIGAGYDLINERAAITSAFAGAPGASFVTYGIDPGPWIGRGGLGAIYTPRDDLEVTGRYDVEHQSGYLNQTASVKFNWAF